MDFAVGTLEQAVRFAAEQRCFVLLDGAGDPQAFITLVPTFGAPNGWALDLLRRGDSAPAGAIDLLLLEALGTLREEGCELLSLGLAPLADFSGAEWPGGGLRRARRLLFSRFNQVYSFAGLAAFKVKYGPRWEPRFLAYPSSSALPQVLWALYRAHFPAQGSRN